MPERLRFFLRRPDYGWQGLLASSALKITPEAGRVQRYANDPGYFRVEEKVRGMKSVVWLPEGVFDPAPFQIEEQPATSGWAREWREVTGDYLRHLWPNSASVLLCLVWMVALVAFLYYSVKKPEATMQWMMNGDVTKITQLIAALCFVPVLISLWVCHRRPARTRLATILLQAEAWLLLISLAGTLPDLPKNIVSARQVANQISSQPGNGF